MASSDQVYQPSDTSFKCHEEGAASDPKGTSCGKDRPERESTRETNVGHKYTSPLALATLSPA